MSVPTVMGTTRENAVLPAQPARLGVPSIGLKGHLQAIMLGDPLVPKHFLLFCVT